MCNINNARSTPPADSHCALWPEEWHKSIAMANWTRSPWQRVLRCFVYLDNTIVWSLIPQHTCRYSILEDKVITSQWVECAHIWGERLDALLTDEITGCFSLTPQRHPTWCESTGVCPQTCARAVRTYQHLLPGSKTATNTQLNEGIHKNMACFSSHSVASVNEDTAFCEGVLQRVLTHR